MKSFSAYSLIILFIFMMMASGCGPSRRAGLPAVDECAPSNLTVRSNDSTLYLTWDTNCSNDKLLSGYDIYLSDKPLYEKYHNVQPPGNIKPFNSTPYPGDTDPDVSFETMTLNNLANGVEYYVSVRTVFPDKTMTVSSNEVPVMCRPEGKFDLDFRFSGTNDGFSFATGRPVRADDELNDLYFYSKDGFDFIASPTRLNGFIRESKFYSLGKTSDIYQYPELKLDYDPVEKIPVLLGQSYLVETMDGNFAKIRIEKITGENKERKLSVSYIYQPVKGLMRF